jgi:hypothetical protein
VLAVWRQHVRDMVRDPALATWCLFVLLTPVYVIPSGLPQPGDLLVFVLAPLVLWRWDGKLDRHSSRAVRALLRFTLWVCVVNYGWAVVLGKWHNPKDFLIFPLFYFFNVAVFFAALVLAKRDAERFLRITVDMVILTIIYQVVASFFYRRDLYRGELFFNNPNQLGYYALLCACVIALCHRRLGLSRFKSGASVAGCAYLALLSASRASVAGVLVLLAFLLFSNPRTIILASLVSIGLLTLGGPIYDAIDAAQQRALEDRDPRKSFAEERGYDRLWKYPEYLITGAGEGDLERFTEPGEKPHELHSSFGSLLFSYGFIGLGLFLAFGVRVVRGAPYRELLMLVPVLVYTVAHNGLRFTTFWMVLAAIAVLKLVPERRETPVNRVRVAPGTLEKSH